MRYDVVIIGAGPAGIACAKKLSEHGRKVLILDKGIGRKVCAGGLSNKVFSILMLPNAIIERQFYDALIGVGNDVRRMAFPVPIVSTVSRERLAEWHLSELDEDLVDVMDNVNEIRFHKGFVEFGANRAEYSYLVGADGAYSAVRQHLGIKAKKYLNAIQCRIEGDYPDLEMIIMAKPLGYYWIFPHKGHAYVGVGGRADEVSMKRLKQMLNRFMEKRNLKPGPYSGGIINYDYQGYRFGKTFLCGEAAGLTSAISAEGIYFALVSGHEVAKEIIKPGYRSIRLKKVIGKARRDRVALGFLSLFESLGLEWIFVPWFLKWKYKNKIRKLNHFGMSE